MNCKLFLRIGCRQISALPPLLVDRDGLRYRTHPSCGPGLADTGMLGAGFFDDLIDRPKRIRESLIR